MPASREEDFLRNTTILHFYPKITFPLGGGHEIYNFLSPYPTNATHQICLSLAQYSSWEEDVKISLHIICTWMFCFQKRMTQFVMTISFFKENEARHVQL